jgi:CBS domain-containing protein
MLVGDICTRDAVRVDLSASIRDAAETMRRHHVGAVVVVTGQSNGGGRPVGILTDRDIVLSVVAKGVTAEDITVADAMTTGIASCKASQCVFDALDIMCARGVRRLPVLDSGGQLVGVVSADDIHALFSAKLCTLSEAMLHEQVRENSLRA